jgi:phosphoserine phosphatase
MHTDSKKHDTPTDVNNVLAPVFIPPFRVGRKQMRAVLDAKGMEVVIFPKGLESYAQEYADFLNITRQNER